MANLGVAETCGRAWRPHLRTPQNTRILRDGRRECVDCSYERKADYARLFGAERKGRGRGSGC